MRFSIFAIALTITSFITGCHTQTAMPPPIDLNEIALTYIREHRPTWVNENGSLPEELDETKWVIIDRGTTWEWTLNIPETKAGGVPEVYIDKKTLKAVSSEKTMPPPTDAKLNDIALTHIRQHEPRWLNKDGQLPEEAEGWKRVIIDRGTTWEWTYEPPKMMLGGAIAVFIDKETLKVVSVTHYQ